MITNTNSYIKTVEIYQQQTKKSCDIVHNYLIDLLKNKYMNSYSLVQVYCENASFLKLLRTTAIKNRQNFIDEIKSDLSW